MSVASLFCSLVRVRVRSQTMTNFIILGNTFDCWMMLYAAITVSLRFFFFTFLCSYIEISEASVIMNVQRGVAGQGTEQNGGFFTSSSSYCFQPGNVKLSCPIYRLADANSTRQICSEYLRLFHLLRLKHLHDWSKV